MKNNPKRTWMVMELNYWSDLEVMGLPVAKYPFKGCPGFLPIFDDYDEAVKFAQSEENIFEIQKRGK